MSNFSNPFKIIKAAEKYKGPMDTRDNTKHTCLVVIGDARNTVTSLSLTTSLNQIESVRTLSSGSGFLRVLFSAGDEQFLCCPVSCCQV